MKILDVIVAVALIIGGLNWGLVGFFNFNLIGAVFGDGSIISRVIYALVGLGALVEVFDLAFDFKSVQHRWCETLSTVRH
jgi:uncharacterized membrane protein YuzA (DUF378 family)